MSRDSGWVNAGILDISYTQVLISQTRGILNIQLFLAQFTRRHFSSDYPINCCQIFSSIKTRVRESGPKLAGIMPSEEFICGARIGVTTLKLKRVYFALCYWSRWELKLKTTFSIEHRRPSSIFFSALSLSVFSPKVHVLIFKHKLINSEFRHLNSRWVG